jgi:diacylglycerol kinase family enzyme
VLLAIERFPRGIAVLAGLWIALFAGWTALRANGVRRVAAVVLMGAAVVGAVVALVLLGGLLLDLVVVAVFVIAAVLARAAFRVHVHLPAAARPKRPVLFMNPWSGGGKARRFNLTDEARARGIEAIELRQGDDLWQLVRDAIEEGADALAMAGGDGSQAIVAQLAAENGLPYACIPAGTRNHFALDLGVDRNDVVGSLDAFVDGGERHVDLAEVNGRVFVNNVSIGLYANAVQQPGYRDEKLRTLFETASSELQAQTTGQALRWRGPDGEDGRDAVVLVISNNLYRLGANIGSGTRPHLDEGVLGVAVASSDAPGLRVAPAAMTLRQWCCRDFTVEAEGPVPAGVDGEAVTLAPPIRFTSMPSALTVRIAPDHPGASPSTGVPRGLGKTVAKLVRIAIGAPRESVDDIRPVTERSVDEHVRS